MVPDPEPLKSIWTLSGECPVVEANPHGIENSNLLEPEGRMPRICLKERKVLVRERPSVLWKLPVREPEVRVSEVVQSGVQPPAS